MLTTIINSVVLAGAGAVIWNTEVAEPIEVLAKIIAGTVWTTCLVCAILSAF